jgi:hypothetical protein
MQWLPLVSTGFGAAIALAGTMFADHVRRRDEHGRDSTANRRQTYLDLVLAMGAALQSLRDVAETDLRGPARFAAGTSAVSPVYPARERFLMTAPPAVVRASETAFDHLIVVRDAVRSGIALRSPAWHDVYHPYSEKVWLLRLAMRRDVGTDRLRPADLGRGGWDDRSHCDACTAATAAGTEMPTAGTARPVAVSDRRPEAVTP